jgi:hypothetical protein
MHHGLFGVKKIVRRRTPHNPLTPPNSKKKRKGIRTSKQVPPTKFSRHRFFYFNIIF